MCSGPDDRLDRFLQTLPPSNASCSDVAWICVDSSLVSHEPGGGSATSPLAANAQSCASPSPPAVEELLSDWEGLCRDGRRPCHADIDALALKHGVLRCRLNSCRSQSVGYLVGTQMHDFCRLYNAELFGAKGGYAKVHASLRPSPPSIRSVVALIETG